MKNDDDDICTNFSSNPHFNAILEARFSRRELLKRAAGMAGMAVIGTAIAGCSNDNDNNSNLELGFSGVPKTLADGLAVPAGYTATVLYRLGDPTNAATSDYANNGTETGTSFAARAGDHHDGMHFFGMTAAGAYDANASERGLLVMNHENITQIFLHANGPTSTGGVRPADEALKEMNAHGVSVIEVTRSANGTYSHNRGSAYNRRITTFTEMTLSGPVAGTAAVRTKFSTDGTRTRGTVNNCANGYTPWGTYLTCEENYAFYFKRAAGDNANRPAGEVAGLNRNGIAQGSTGNFGWTTPTPADANDTSFSRWDATKLGTSTDGTDDFRNVANTFGWVVEIDPFNVNSTPKKRTALGRFAHEGAWPAPVVAGRPIVYYSGDDSRGEYFYKFVSTQNWDPADATRGLAAGDKYLDAGRLFVARFNADGSGNWLELPATADALLQTRLAADTAGATKMDRPEWGAVDPRNGQVYLTLTNNSQRGGVAQPLDPANPRYYADTRGSATTRGNANGHIVRLRPTGDDHTSATFQWDIYLFGAQARADTTAADADYQANVNLSGLDDTNDFSSPDGLWFSQATPGLLWIQTDDGQYTDVTNCMLLAALPGEHNDGATIAVANRAVPQGTGGAQVDVNITTKRGKRAEPANLRRFLVGPPGSEITGVAESPDGRALFINVQHPGENTSTANFTAGNFESRWPQGGSARPRSATVVITRNDGGKVGVA